MKNFLGTVHSIHLRDDFLTFSVGARTGPLVRSIHSLRLLATRSNGAEANKGQREAMALALQLHSLLSFYLGRPDFFYARPCLLFEEHAVWNIMWRWVEIGPVDI
jgi:hypothetical protein